MTEATNTAMQTAGRGAAAGVPAPDDVGSGTVKALVKRYWPAVIALLVVVGFVSLSVPRFFTSSNLSLIGQQSAVTGVAAVGMTFVILTAGIDLSVGAILGLVSVLAALLLQHSVNPWLVVIVGALAGTAVGMVNGLGVAWLRIQPFVLTLATAAIVGGVALNQSGGTQLQLPLIHGGILGFLANGRVGGLPGAFIIFLLCAIVAGLVLRYTAFGRYIYAVGGSEEAARLSGIRVRQIQVAVYAVAGLCAAVAGILATARVNVGDPNGGTLTTLDSIAAVVIGGTSLFGGAGGVSGSVFGAVLLAALSDGLNMKGVSAFDQQIVKGIVIIVAVLWVSFHTNGLAGLRSMGVMLRRK